MTRATDAYTSFAKAAELADHRARRTPEAQADIAAARAPSCAHAIYQSDCPSCAVDLATAEAEREARAAQEGIRQVAAISAGRPIGGPLSSEVVDLDTALSNAALADTPAVREMGGATPEQATYGRLRRELAHAFGVDPDTDWQLLLTTAASSALTPPGAVVLIGPEADRYRALQTAARKAQESAVTARADGAALLQLFQAFCAGVAPAKEG